MYNRTLHIGLYGIDSEAASAICAAQAPEKFGFEFVTCEAADRESLANCEIAIVSADAAEGMSFDEMHNLVYADEKGFCALIAVAAPELAATWSKDTLDALYAIWPSPLSATRATYEFEKVIDHAKHVADSFMTNVYLDTLIDSMPEMVWFKRLDGAHMKVNSYFCDIVDKEREDVIGQYHNYIWNVPEEDWDKAELTCKVSEDEAIAVGHTCQFEENVSTHGEIRLFATYKTPIYDVDGTVLGTSGFAHDVTLERELQRLLWLNARTDYLTETYNRRYFTEYLEEHADEAPFTFLMLDLDNFKDVNDSKGHTAGDETLRIVSELMRKYFEDCPIVRWGGDEFIIIIPESRGDMVTSELFDSLVKDIQEQSLEATGVAITASGGLVRNVTPETADDAIIDADKALYEAKQAGKSCLVFV